MGKGGIYETEAQRLQREADEYTKMLEHERKYPTLPLSNSLLLGDT